MGMPYSLTLKNDSTAAWTFYIYQQFPEQPGGGVQSLAWLTSPYVMAPGTEITFHWTADYGFAWRHNGKIGAGVSYQASGELPADLNMGSLTNFTVADNTPTFSAAEPGNRPGSLAIRTGQDIPAHTFEIGISMSGVPCFLTSALPNLMVTFTPRPGYWIAAGTSVQTGDLLDTGAIVNTLEVTFPPGVFAHTYSLGADNVWHQVEQ